MWKVIHGEVPNKFLKTKKITSTAFKMVFENDSIIFYRTKVYLGTWNILNIFFYIFIYVFLNKFYL